MDGVAELLANNGFFAAGEENAPKPRRSLVKRGALLGAMLTFIGPLVIVPIHTHGRDGKESLALIFFYWVALLALIGVSGYLKRLITNIVNIFSEEESSSSKRSGPHRGPTLPAAYSAPVSDPGRQFVDTAKVAQPSSI